MVEIKLQVGRKQKIGLGGGVRDGRSGAGGAAAGFGRSQQGERSGGRRVPARSAFRAASTRRFPLRSPCGDRQNPARRFAPDRRGEGVIVEDMPQASPVSLCPCRTTTEDRTTSLPVAEEQITAARSVFDSTLLWRCVSGNEAQ